MLTIFGQKQRYCDGISRRGFLEIGAVGLCGLTLSDLLCADELHQGRTDSKKSFINVFLSGGPSHIDTFDPKPDAPREIRGEFSPIETSVPGIQICEHLPRIAKMMDKFAIIRSLAGLVDEHDSCQTETGWSLNSLRSAGGRPSVGAVVSKLHGANNGVAPRFVDLSNVTKTGFLGSVYSAFRPDGQGRSNLLLNKQITVNRLDDRQQLLAGLDRLRREADNTGTMRALDAFTERAVGVITSGGLSTALDLDREDPGIRARYTGEPAGTARRGGRRGSRENERFLLARRLIEAGVRCVSLSWGGWDTHGDNFGQLKGQLPQIDNGIATLVEDLDSRGMLHDVVIAVWGEFGRTPRVNSNAGRDHWPRAASGLFAGGRFRTGQVIGATNRFGESPQDRPVHLHEVFATIYQHLGIDPKCTTIVDNNGRPQYLLDKPTPVSELV